MARPLPDPTWTERPTYCVVCGYSLEGLVPPGLCPECGAPFDREVMVLTGVPTRPGGPLWRRVAWGFLIGAGVVYGHLWVYFLVGMAWQLSLTLGVAIAIGVVAMLATSPRERRGREQFIFSSAGVARLPITGERQEDRVDSLFTPWEGANEVELKRHSAFWRRLRIGYRAGPGHSAFTVVFDAGVRCPDADEARVLATIRACLNPPLDSSSARSA